MDKYHLYWFSGSGNSLLVCQTIKAELEAANKTVMMFPMDKVKASDVDPFVINGFVVSVYEQGLNPLVWNFLNNLPEGKKQGVFFVDTLMMYSGGVKGPVKRIFKKKNYLPLGAVEIVMPNNYYKRKLNFEKDQLKREKGIIKAKQFVRDLLNNETKFRDIPLYSTLMAAPSKSNFVSKIMNKFVPVIINEELCNQCGICTAICPTGHIIKDEETNYPKTVDSVACIQCLRCMAFCHSEAIKVGSIKNLRYHGVSIKEMVEALK